ncbi:helix-turn-helix domain-containing protein [Acetobacter sp. A11-2]|uniref:Crp/Fnr family transcriptional regulator n=1 Tax=Acetobacter sp. A11-2 TaxID=3157859 RepID=UPI0032ECDFEA
MLKVPGFPDSAPMPPSPSAQALHSTGKRTGRTDTESARCLMCKVRDYNLCSSIEDQDVAVLAHATRQITLPPGTAVIEEGTPASAFFNVINGTVKLFKSLPDGRRQITGFADAGQFVGLSNSRTYSFGAETVSSVLLCRCTHTQIENLLAEYPRFARHLLSAVTNELTDAKEQMLLLGRKTAKEKVASFLLDRIKQYHRTHPHDPDAETTASVPMTRVDIADYLGLTIETVSRTISALRRDKIISGTENHCIRILSLPNLQDIAYGLKSV